MNVEFEETDVVNAVPSGNGKIMLVYQSKFEIPKLLILPIKDHD